MRSRRCPRCSSFLVRRIFDKHNRPTVDLTWGLGPPSGTPLDRDFIPGVNIREARAGAGPDATVRDLSYSRTPSPGKPENARGQPCARERAGARARRPPKYSSETLRSPPAAPAPIPHVPEEMSKAKLARAGGRYKGVVIGSAKFDERPRSESAAEQQGALPRGPAAAFQTARSKTCAV
ncbi:hypothetical protein EVAR_55207_1 [Eumeta japonica]|uniref:Uncharacterized protein n=1 Tax=Eumeta variegata TaxID=151549 RepID=A0A4C1ZRD6_EUMVA|nr:hypothetical protein EVAR_55207_1 [Eumeta japonica]